ncbi:helix-turn-helix transcriptional regulator [Leptothermofonsia sp. ETS-13]|uniref:helix-turn-helix transcriptional regulator n=1 Tax=Leptothermofonsia sp. ETS-13 TaxID=3035696 RepID=UPI003BA3AC73
MPRKKETLTLSVPPGTKEKLEAIAERLNLRWGKSPSPSKLVTVIAQGQISVGKSRPLNGEQVEALRQSIKVLVDTGFIEEARSVIALLLEQGDLEAPLRQALLQQFNQSTPAWREQLDHYIAQKQPFRVAYRNSQGERLELNARYAEVQFQEKRFYLQIWCDETADIEADIPDLPELWHNRCLRIDRIQSLEPIAGEWRGELDSIKVYLQFKGWLANAYEPKPGDIDNQVIGDVRQIVRRVANPFWLIREVSRYWEDCEIIAPDALRDRFRQKLETLCNVYGMEIRKGAGK